MQIDNATYIGNIMECTNNIKIGDSAILVGYYSVQQNNVFTFLLPFIQYYYNVF